MVTTTNRENLELVLSEVTVMKNDRVCVAGWSERLGAMVRPLHNGFHWPDHLAQQKILAVGNVIRLDESPAPSQRGYPHASEDRPVAGAPHLVDVRSRDELLHLLAPMEKTTVAALFGSALIDKKYVFAGSRCPSLGAVKVDAWRMGFKDEGHGLRCWFYDHSNTSYCFKVTSRELRELHRAAGVDALETMRRRSTMAHLRLGLPNPWCGPEGDWTRRRCYVQINGVIFS